MKLPEINGRVLVRTAAVAVKAGVLLLAWLGSVALAATLAAVGYLAVAIVIIVALSRIALHVAMPQRGATRRAGVAWTVFGLLTDALTLVGAGVLVIAGVLIAAAALSSPVLWSGLPGVLAVITGVHAGTLVARSISGAKTRRQSTTQKLKYKPA